MELMGQYSNMDLKDGTGKTHKLALLLKEVASIRMIGTLLGQILLPRVIMFAVT